MIRPCEEELSVDNYARFAKEQVDLVDNLRSCIVLLNPVLYPDMRAGTDNSSDVITLPFRAIKWWHEHAFINT